MSDLRSKVIKLAQEHPEFRKDLVPILREAGILDKLKDMFFKNPETGNKVKFDSLPPEEQKKIQNRSKGNSGGDSGGSGAEDDRITAKNAPKKVTDFKGDKKKVMDSHAFGQDRYDAVEKALKIKDDAERSLTINKVFADFEQSKEGKGYRRNQKIDRSTKNLQDQVQKNVQRKKDNDSFEQRYQDKARSEQDARKQQEERDAPKKEPEKKPKPYRQWSQGELSKSY
jgi:hypothetical protein